MSDWIFTEGRAPAMPQVPSFQLVYALGRLGDVYGPIPLEMIADDAWTGHMGGYSHDLIAYRLCSEEWRCVIAYDPKAIERPAVG